MQSVSLLICKRVMKMLNRLLMHRLIEASFPIYVIKAIFSHFAPFKPYHAQRGLTNSEACKSIGLIILIRSMDLQASLSFTKRKSKYMIGLIQTNVLFVTTLTLRMLKKCQQTPFWIFFYLFFFFFF